MRYEPGHGAKLRIGDKVVPNGRAPRWLMEGLRRNRYRTVVGIIRDPQRRCLMYMLGQKPGHTGYIGAYAFRSYQLNLVVPRPPGRPRVRRVYRVLAPVMSGSAPVGASQLVVRPLAL